LLGEPLPESGIMNTESVVLVIAAIVAVDAVGVAVFIRRRRSRRLASERGDAASFHGSTGSGAEAPVIENVPGSSIGRRRAPWPILAIVFISIGLALALAAGISAAVVAESISGDRHVDGTVVDLVLAGREAIVR
jgi:preprotein translocase subunit SecG